jgi:hypothetical protein
MGVKTGYIKVKNLLGESDIITQENGILSLLRGKRRTL